MKHYNILIISKNNPNPEIFNGVEFLCKDDASVSELNFAKIDGEKISWDYLITDNECILNNFNLFKDDNYFITNYFFQSSIDEIFIIGKHNNSNHDYNYQYQTIIDFLK